MTTFLKTITAPAVGIITDMRWLGGQCLKGLAILALVALSVASVGLAVIVVNTGGVIAQDTDLRPGFTGYTGTGVSGPELVAGTGTGRCTGEFDTGDSGPCN